MSLAVVFATSGASMWAWVWMAIFAALCWRGLSRRSRRIIGALVHELRRRGGGLGCAAICSGGGQGDAIIIRVNGA